MVFDNESKAIRGAISVVENTQEYINEAALKLVTEQIDRNCLTSSEIQFILFSVTNDLTASNPATCVRKSGLDVPFFCMQEAQFDDSMPRIIRTLIFTHCTKKVHHVYLGNAVSLRPDISS